MAIKIIRHGAMPKTICPFCDCYFSCEREDVTVEQTDINDYNYFVICPDCGQKCYIDTIPKSIQEG